MRSLSDRQYEQPIAALDQGLIVTEERDETVEEEIVVMQTGELTEELDDNDGDDYAEDKAELDIADVLEESEDDLTAYDIMGFDPLDVLTLQEVADYLKVSTSAVHRMMKEQKLPGRNIGGEWRYLRDAVANWLRCEEAPAQQQQKSREEYSKAKPPAPRQAEEADRFSSPPPRTSYQPDAQRTPYQSDYSGGGEYKPRQRFPEGGQQYGNQGGGQYGNRGGSYSGGQSGGGQYGRSGGQYGGQSSGGYTPPPRRPFRSEEGGSGSAGQGEGGYGGGNRSGGYQGGGNQGGGYQGGGYQQFGGAKRKNKRQVFTNERGKRMDRRKSGDDTASDE